MSMSSSGATSAEQQSRPRPVWPWAAGSILAVVLVLGSAFGVHRFIAPRLNALPPVPPPAAPLLSVVAVTPPGVSYAQIALDRANGHLVALTRATVSPQCPPTGACPLPAPLQSFAVFDASTGATLAQTPLTGVGAAASGSIALLSDSSRHRAYAVSPDSVTIFSTDSAAVIGAYALPSGVSATGATLAPIGSMLYIAASGQLLALDATTGHPLMHASLPSGVERIDGPQLDPIREQLYALVHIAGSAAPTLAAYDARTLTPEPRLPLSGPATLGPLDAATHSLYFFAPDGTVTSLALATSSVQPPAPVPSLRNATALGWDTKNDLAFRATSTALDALNTSGRTVATLPLRIVQPPDQPLLVDYLGGLLYLTTDQGALVIAHISPSATLSPATALILARAALAHLLPDTNQNPPFVAPETFPLTGDAHGATQNVNYWIHYSDLGWKGPYPGTAQSAIAFDSAHPGGYIATFTISWYQLFQRTHTWICVVAPNGSVSLQSDSGDAVP
ncbi:MAG: hypothetical protein OJF49_000734 [Ktedonobacterales bacterium]|jgi:hypothetical protein|nr:MAG: hypothetical protein OJF49_000734 [Ktedonobacterales bacterium]